MYREEQSGASFVLGMMTGAFIGAGVALLFAPRTGREMRTQLGDQYRGLADRVGETTNTLRESASTLRERASTLREQGRERVHQVKSALSDRLSSSLDRTATDRPSVEADQFPSSAPSV